jgi:hypothetical protein
MADKFKVSWEAHDGYCGGSSPHAFNIHADALEDDMDDNALRTLFCAEVQADFEQKVSWSSKDEDKFVEWAKAQITGRCG